MGHSLEPVRIALPAGQGRPLVETHGGLWRLARFLFLAGFISLGLLALGRVLRLQDQPGLAPSGPNAEGQVVYVPVVVNEALPTTTPFPSPSTTAPPNPTITAPPNPTSTAVSASGTFYVNGQSGIDSNPGTSASPWRTVAHAIDTVPRGATVVVADGIYRVSELTFGPPGLSASQRTTFKAAPGARVIFSTAADLPPTIYMSDYVRLEGLWFGGQYQNGNEQVWGGFRVGGGPIGVGRQIVNCTLFGYREGIQIGSSENLLVQGNRLVWSGHGELMHGIYLSGGYTAGSLSQHVIVDKNLFISGEGWGIHGWHQIHTGIITRNFVTEHNYGSVMDGSDHLVANNLFWRQNGGQYSAKGFWLAGSQIAFYNNLLGPDSRISSDSRLTGNTLLNNAFLGPNTNAPPLGAAPVVLTAGQEQTQLGLSAVQIDSTILALEQAFSQPVAMIHANGNVETWFGTLQMTVPSSSPLYRTGAAWFGQALNIGPDSPAPASESSFWAAFRALGLREWDRYGSVTP